MHIVSATYLTYLSADPRMTLKTLNCLTSPTKDQPNLGKPNEMLSFRSVESTTSTPCKLDALWEKKTTTKTNFHFLHLLVYKLKSCGSFALFLPKTGYHYVSHNPYGSVHICTPPGKQPGSLPPSLAPVCLSRSLSLSPPVVCKHPIAVSLQKKIPVI
jgi:hypothetical protein